MEAGLTGVPRRSPGSSAEHAVLATLLYRLFSYWLPLPARASWRRSGSAGVTRAPRPRPARSEPSDPGIGHIGRPRPEARSRYPASVFVWSSVCGERPAVMGVVNVTPDSFSDGGRFLDPDAAVAHGLALVAAGADLLDVGGESTRPGAEPVDRRRGAAPGAAGRRALAAETGGAGQHRHHQGGGRRRRARRRARRSSTTSRPAAPTRDMLDVVADAGAGLRRDAHAGRAAHDAATIRTTTTSSRGRRLPRRARSTPRAPPASPPTRCAPIPASASARRARTTSTLLARLAELVARVEVPRARRHVAQVVPRRVCSASAASPRRRARRRHARHRGVGGRPRRARSCGCTTSAPRSRRASRLCSTMRTVDASAAEAMSAMNGRARALGAGPRAPRVLLGHQGPARGVGAARRLRAQPPQGAPPGGADLARSGTASRTSSRCSTRRTTCTRTRRRASPYAHVPARAPRRVARAAAGRLRHARELARRSRPSGCSSTTRSSATGCSACSPATCSTRASSPRARTRSSSSRRSPAASSARPGTRDRRGHRRRAASCELRPTEPGAELEHDGHDRHRRAARARGARRAARGADAARSRSRSTSSSPSTSTPAGETDALDDTVDYSAVARGGEPGRRVRALPAARAAGDAHRRGVPRRRPRHRRSR